jgi:hypothetical protein
MQVPGTFTGRVFRKENIPWQELLGNLALWANTRAHDPRQSLTASHLFFNRSATPELIAAIKFSSMFVIPTLITLSSALGNYAATPAANKRVSSRLSRQWVELNIMEPSAVSFGVPIAQPEPGFALAASEGCSSHNVSPFFRLSVGASRSPYCFFR